MKTLAAVELDSGEPSRRAAWLAPSSAHLIGCAGAGMRALAAVLSEAGWRTSGSDSQIAGHAASNLPPDCRLAIYSPAVSPDNVELRAARSRGIPTFSYPQMVGRLMRRRRGVAIAGSHGKSTAAALAAGMLRAAGLDPTVLVGAAPIGASAGGSFGRGPLLVAEACEYREHFCHLRPEIAAILNIEWDHVDCFGSVEEVESAFRRFVAGMPPGGTLLAAADCPRSLAVARESGREHASFGFAPDADWRAVDVAQTGGRYRFCIERSRNERDRLGSARARLGPVALEVAGRHNVLNALAAAAVASRSGAPDESIIEGVARFAGLERRLQPLGEAGGVAVVDDYAHHPTAVAAALAAVREAHAKRRVWAVFQPHQAARTRALLDDFARSLQNADRVFVADAFLVREPDSLAGPREPARAQTAEDLGARAPGDARPASIARQVARQLAQAARAQGGSVAAAHSFDEINDSLLEGLRPGDVLVTIGAGNIGKIAHGFIHRL